MRSPSLSLSLLLLFLLDAHESTASRRRDCQESGVNNTRLSGGRPAARVLLSKSPPMKRSCTSASCTDEHRPNQACHEEKQNSLSGNAEQGTSAHRVWRNAKLKRRCRLQSVFFQLGTQPPSRCLRGMQTPPIIIIIIDHNNKATSRKKKATFKRTALQPNLFSRRLAARRRRIGVCFILKLKLLLLPVLKSHFGTAPKAHRKEASLKGLHVLSVKFRQKEPRDFHV